MQIAVVGMACRLPGADSIDAYWRVVRDGVSTVRRLPPDRFDRELYFHPQRGVRNRSYSDLGCLVNYDAHGDQFATLPEAVRECPEVAYRTLCEVAAEAIADARLGRQGAMRPGGGVYLGHARNSGLAGDLTYGTCIAQTAPLLHKIDRFRELGVGRDEIVDEIIEEVRREYPHRDEDGGPHLGANIAASLLAHTFGVKGPCMAFNSACASSLYALAQAVRALQHGRIEFALVGGASYCHHDTLVMFSQAQSLSAEASRPFDADADGMIVGEGYVVVILKTLEQALRDGDSIQAVIRGIGISSDGKGKSLWAPRKEGQIEAIRRAYRAGLTTKNLRYIEAHATSTQLGDATEVAALAEAIDLPPGARVALGSVKANIGHTLETAGLSGLLKTVLCMRHRTIAPVIHVNRPNDKIDWPSLPFYLPRAAEPWPAPADGAPRRAAVNAFGIGGLNVHVVVDDYVKSNSRVTVAAAPGAAQHLQGRAPGDAIAVVGRGVVLPGALGVAALAELVASGRDPKAAVCQRRLNSEVYLHRSAPRHWQCLNNVAGEVRDFEYDWRKHKIPPKQIAQGSPLQFMILDAVDQAFREAGCDGDKMDRSRIGVVVGTPFGGEFASQLLMGLRVPDFQRRLNRLLARHGCSAAQRAAISEQFEKTLVEHLPALLDETGSFTSSSLASRITKTFDLMGGGVAVDAGSCSSSAALTCSTDLLLSHDCDMLVCVGGHEDLGPTRFEEMGLAGLLEVGTARSPFDADARGCAPGEGCAAVLLMRLADARRQQRKVFCSIRSIGAATTGNRREASRRAVEEAFSCVGRQAESLAPTDVVRIETTSIGVPQWTADELEGLRQGYARRAAQRPMLLDCLTPQTGHLGAASGMASLVKASIELEKQEVSASFGLTRTMSSIDANRCFEVSDKSKQFTPSNAKGRLVTAVHNADHRAAYHMLVERGAPVDVLNNRFESSKPASGYAIETIDDVLLFDATRRRKESMLEKAKHPSSTRMAAAAAAGQVESAVRLDFEPPPAEAETETSLQVRIEQPRVHLSKPELEQFLISFIVEQTGYPPEFVEMGADLEADLGIDSIKKAQMFGELGERFSLTPDEHLTLDDFPTLRHVVDYLAAPGESRSVQAKTPIAAPESKVAAPPTFSAGAPVPSSESTRAPQEVASRSATCKRAISSPEQLEQFLIHFIVDQTGYPSEFVELDSDLEADLGIDTIRKGQLLSELGEDCGIAFDGNLARNGFATLRHVFEHLLGAMAIEPTAGDRPGTEIESELPAAATLPLTTDLISPTTAADDPATEIQPGDDQLDLIPGSRRLNRAMDLLAIAGLSVPYFTEHEGVTRDTARVDGREMVTFSSTNYLGMSGDPVVSAAAKEAVDKFGTSVSASRLIAGKTIHRELEEDLRKFLRTDAALVFSSGYSANESTIGHLFGPGDLVIHDALAHSCIIQGAVLSGARRLNFPHNDPEALDRLLRELRPKHRRTLIAIEGAYSMDGDYPDLPRFLELKRRHKAFLLVDDAHALGTMGPTGRGISEHFRIDPREIDLWVATLSKALGSCGGFVAGSRDLIKYLKHSVPGFIYTDALSPAATGAALASLHLLAREPERVAKLQSNARLLLKLAKARGLDTGSAGDTPIVPVMVGNSHTALLLSRRLSDRGIDIRPIVYPAVENDRARLRFMVTSQHTEQQIRTAIDALAEDLKVVAAESVPIEEWKSYLSGRTPLPDLPTAKAPSGSGGKIPAAQSPQPTRDIEAPAAVEPPMPRQADLSPERRSDNVAGPLTQRPSESETPKTRTEPEWSAARLQQYLVNFIVEQTGYPPEFVEMDADLEADLGIDSIKKAQLFGELGEHFSIVPDETLTLDDFPTLQHVFEFIAHRVGARS